MARGWSQKAAFEVFRAERGWGDDSRASYGALERGQRDPDEDEQQYFLEFYGFEELPPEPVSETAQAVQGGDELIVALTRQTEAIESLVALLAPLVADQATGFGARLAALEPVVRRLAKRGLASNSARPLPRKTTG